MMTTDASPAPFFEREPLFLEAEKGQQIRFPKIIADADGTVLAFAETCRQLRRSEDQGETWSKVEIFDTDMTGNAMLDENSGDVLVVCVSGGYLWRSSDHGKTWAREEIVIKPNEAGHGAAPSPRATGGASEQGITLRFGEHVGRLLMPVRIQPPAGGNAQEHWPYNYNTSIYSDDGGRTWQVGEPVQSGTGEGTLAELSDGRIYYNSRCHMAVDNRRRIAWSHDGGHRWTDWQVSEDLFEVGEPFYYKYGTKPSYGCNAGLVRLPDEVTGGKDVLIFSTLDNPGGTRDHMTVWASFDGGKTWPVKRLVFEGFSAYSSLAADKKGNIYLLFEHGREAIYDSIALTRFNLQWLTNGRDWREFPPD